MLYFMSDIHGAYDAFLALLKKVKFSENDRLYIIGDVLDGNTHDPKANWRLLEYIMSHDNIELLLGNHELAHAGYLLADSKGDIKQKQMWKDYLCDPLCGGKPLVDFWEENPLLKMRYLQYLIARPVSVLVQEDDRFYYLVHGKPVACTAYQRDIDYINDQLQAAVNFKENITQALRTDPHVVCESGVDMDQVTKENLYAVVGHTPVRYVTTKSPQEPGEKKYQRITKKNHIVDIDCGCRANSLCKRYPNSEWISDLAIVRAGKRMTVTYYSEIKSP